MVQSSPHRIAHCCALFDESSLSQKYEIAHLIPSKICRDVAGPTVDLLLFNTPKFLHPFGKLAVSALLDDRLRAAVMYVLENYRFALRLDWY